MQILAYYLTKRVLGDTIFQRQLLHRLHRLAKEAIIGIQDVLVETAEHREKDVEVSLVSLTDEERGTVGKKQIAMQLS